MMKEKAYFVFRPRRAEDLSLENPNGKLREYHIVKTICLSKIDYDNFSTDLLADRQFIEENAELCVKEGDCLLVTTKQRKESLLIIPWKSCFVRYAARKPAVHVLR